MNYVRFSRMFAALALGIVLGMFLQQNLDMNGQVTANSTRMEDMKQKISDIDAGLTGESGVYARLAIIEERLAKVDQRLDRMEQRLNALEAN